MNKKIIIIGAGIAGLSAGCFGQINGYETEIFEMQNVPGGLCTSWKRKNYTFDGCLHYLIGTSSTNFLNTPWKAVGAFGNNGNQILNHDVYMQIENEEGKKLILYSNVDRLEEHLLEISPDDSRLIFELTNAIREFSIPNLKESVKKSGGIMYQSMEDFLKDFKSPFLKESLSIFKNSQLFLSTMAAYNTNNAGWILGGSLRLAANIQNHYLDLGGKINFKTKVEEIIIKDDRAIGIRLQDNSIHEGDSIISAADGYSTIFHMLHGKYVSNEITSLYTRGKTYPTSVQVSLGIADDLSDEPHSLCFKLDTPVEVGGEFKSHFLINNYCFDKSICPLGKSVITTIIKSGYDYWNKLGYGSDSYKNEKSRFASAFIKILEDRFPRIKNKIEVIDVATPLTYARYTGAWKGAYMGWLSTPEMIIRDLPSVLPGLKGFYMTGQWTYSRGGLPTAMMTARGCLNRLCHEDGKEFSER